MSNDPPEGLFPIDEEYTRTISALKQTGVLTNLPRSKTYGVTGVDGQEYPAPTLEQLRQVFSRRKELVERKTRQGFTQLQLTPIAMPCPQLMEQVNDAVRRHAEAGKLFQTKQHSSDADTPISLHKGEPIWMWNRVRQALDTPYVVYFPQDYTDHHQGLTKEEVIRKPRYCAVPGWSLGLIEPIPVMPQPGQGKVIGGRKQLETNSSPREYLETLGTPEYRGETGWTLEDFLTHFITQLETTNQVSHDRSDGNGLWMLGAYMPDSMPNARLVPTGNWSSDAGRRIYMGAHRTGNSFRSWAARSTVRLGA